MSSSGGRLRPELVYLGNRPKVLFYHCPNSTQLPPNDRPIATQLPPNCHPIATQSPPNHRPITAQLPPNCHWCTMGTDRRCSPLTLTHFSLTRPFSPKCHTPISPLYAFAPLPPPPPQPRPTCSDAIMARQTTRRLPVRRLAAPRSSAIGTHTSSCVISASSSRVSAAPGAQSSGSRSSEERTASGRYTTSR